MGFCLQRSASIQLRTSLSKFGGDCRLHVSEFTCITCTECICITCIQRSDLLESAAQTAPASSKDLFTHDFADSNSYCWEWAKMGECRNNTRYMAVHCKASCRRAANEGLIAPWPKNSTFADSTTPPTPNPTVQYPERHLRSETGPVRMYWQTSEGQISAASTPIESRNAKWILPQYFFRSTRYISTFFFAAFIAQHFSNIFSNYLVRLTCEFLQ